MAYTDYNWITDRLAVGGTISEPGNLPFDAVLSLETSAPCVLKELVAGEGLDYRWHSIMDGQCGEEHEEIVRRFEEAAQRIKQWLEEDRKILVHCGAGVSRSATAVVWYLTRYEGYGWEEATALVRERRPMTNPNIFFEIPLRMEHGEPIDEEWIRRRINEFCERHYRVLEQLGLSAADVRERFEVELDPAEIWEGLVSQGSVGRVGSSY